MNVCLNQLPYSWHDFFVKQMNEDYFKKLQNYLISCKESNVPIFPKSSNIFNAFKFTPFNKIKCCIIGQDPYFLPKMANGLAFSVDDGIEAPRSLKNILKELSNNGFKDENNNLTSWSKQGVFLLNCILTVEAGKPKSHKNRGWEIFTSEALKLINKEHENIVFLAWGKDAHKICSNILDSSKNYLIKTSHPSPLGARKKGTDFSAFLGSNCFNNVNEILMKNNIEPINWNLE